MCTLKTFPFIIEHCIEWGKEKFGVLFTSRPEEAIKFMEDTDDFMNEMQKSRKGEIENVLTTISEFINLKKDFASLA
jgi:hypothetical protein